MSPSPTVNVCPVVEATGRLESDNLVELSGVSSNEQGSSPWGMFTFHSVVTSSIRS